MDIQQTLTSFPDFTIFSEALEARFLELSRNSELFRADISGDDLWDLYLKSYPEGTNPIFRVRTHYDGSMDRSVVRKIGNVVGIVDGKVVSIWSINPTTIPYPFNVVAQQLSEAVSARPIADIFLTDYSTVGARQTIERLEDDATIRWKHFFVPIPAHLVKEGMVDTLCGRARTAVETLRRGLETITPSALNSIVDLIESNNLYRGAEFMPVVQAFIELQRQYTPGDVAFLYQHYGKSHLSGFRNSVIGTLAVDISEGMDLEVAVRMFEQKVAPANYQRTKSIISPAMVQDAMKTIQRLDIEASLERRFATVADVSVNNVLWADGKIKPTMRGGVESLLMREAQTGIKVEDLRPITVEDFLRDVVPTAVHMEVSMDHTHIANLMSITAPVHENSTRLFKWDNGFAWSYTGNLTDSIRERVKAAGGNVQAEFRVSLSWYNYDDLDLHAVIRDSSHSPTHIFYGNKLGILDVDMNAGRGSSRSPVENMAFTRIPVGRMVFAVRQFMAREAADYGFEIEMEYRGLIRHYRYAKAVQHGEQVALFSCSFDRNGTLTVADVNKELAHGLRATDVWGIRTNSYIPVSMLMYSPNHWDGQEVGNKHLFFILEGCRNESPARGIYNEFLRSELTEHRKVFEILGDKTKCAVSENQLSGLGFSSTIRNALAVKVHTGETIRQYNVQF